ncbi:hypothetical protein Tco_1497398, partial [Tanacetum coccineum]
MDVNTASIGNEVLILLVQGEVCTAKAVRLILLGTKWFMLLALSDIGHSGELRLLVASNI